jgi:hypothetical protein
LRFAFFFSAGIGKSKSTKLEGHPNSTPCDNHCSGSHHNIRGKWTSPCCTHSRGVHILFDIIKMFAQLLRSFPHRFTTFYGFGNLELAINNIKRIRLNYSNICFSKSTHCVAFEIAIKSANKISENNMLFSPCYQW